MAPPRASSPANSDSSFEFIEHDHPPVQPQQRTQPIIQTQSQTQSLPASNDADLSDMTARLAIERIESEDLPSYEEASIPNSTPVVLSPALAHAVPTTRSPPAEEIYETAEQEKARLGASYAEEAPRSVIDDEQIPVYSTLPADNSSARGPAPTNVAALNRGLQIPSQTAFMASGFPYPEEELNAYGVSREDWGRFTSEITAAAKLEPSEWAVALGTGAGTFLLAGIFIGWFALIPGIMVGHVAHRKQEKQKVSDALHGAHGDLEEKLLKWNQEFFAPRGLLIRLDLPGQSDDMENMSVYKNSWVHKWMKEQKERRAAAGERGGCCGSRSSGGGCSSRSAARASRWEDKMARKEARWEERSQRKEAKWENKLRKRAVKRGRIVIMPIDNGSSSSSAAAAARAPFSVPVSAPADEDRKVPVMSEKSAIV